MDRIDNVSVVMKANIYENGRCQSRTIIYPDNTRKTLGVYLPGEFVFDSHEPEKVMVTYGKVEVLFEDDADWRTVNTGEFYDVPANCTFKVRCDEIAEYICDYL